MTGTGSETPSERIARRIKQLRGVRGMSVKALAKACEDLGVPRLNQSVITNIEVVGRRQDIGVGELLVLARALDVSPLVLLMPEESRDLVVSSELSVDPYRLVLWFAGVMSPTGLPTVGFEREAATIRWYRAAYDAQASANGADRNARWARKDGEEAEADRFVQERDRHLQSLANAIDSLIEAGMTPPMINPGWARVMIRRGWFRNPDRVLVVELPEDE